MWKLWTYDTAGNLFWLGLEQLTKTIIVQSELLDKKYIKEEQIKQLKTKTTGTEDFCTVISQIFKKINGTHSVDGLISGSSQFLKTLLIENKVILENINKLYLNRYYTPKNRTIF